MTVQKAISVLRTRLETAAPDLLPLLEIIEQQLRPEDRSSIGEIEQGGVRYVVENSAIGETLAEHRLSGKSKPFRCSKKLYKNVAEVLLSADHAMSVAEIAATVEKLTGDRPAEFQVRVPLRLWTSSEIGVLARHRAKYRPADRDAFISATTKLWSQLASKVG